MIRFEAGHLAEELSRDLHSWSWFAGGKLLRSFCFTGLEAGLLGHGIQIATQFFPLKVGDLVLLKDCQVGGPGRDRLALIQCFREERNGEPALYMASGFYAPTTLSMKLPPIPLRSGGEINSAVLAALGQCESKLRREIENQDRIRELSQSKAFRALWTAKALSEELDREKNELQRLIADLPDGEVTTELHCGGEMIRVRLEVEHGQMHFHFAGTTVPIDHLLPLAAASGIVRATVREWLRWPKSLSAACESLISMSTPTGCLLNPPSKLCCDKNITASAALLKTAIESALHLWDRRVNRGLTNYFDARAILSFENSAPYTLSVPAGSAAQDQQEGVSFFDQRALGMGFSPEKFELLCPVLVEKLEERPKEDKSSKTSGGPGLSLSFRALKAGKMKWQKPPNFRVTLKKGQSPLNPSGVTVLRGEQAIEPDAEGLYDLQENDLVTLKSGSGGGLL